MIREPWAACAAFPAGRLHESRKSEYNDRQQANCRQENHSACGVKLGRHRGYARLVRSRRSSSEQRLSPLSSAAPARPTAMSSFVWGKKGTVTGNSRLEPRLATVIGARGGIRPRTVGEGGNEIGKLCVAALGDESSHGVAPTPAARLADQVQERRLEVGQDDGAIARHGPDATAPARTEQERGRRASAKVNLCIGRGKAITLIRESLSTAPVIARLLRQCPGTDSKAVRRGPGHAVNVKVLPVPQSTSFSGISRLARSMKFCPLQCMGMTCSRSNFFSSAITFAR
jgi:hypothetical protein